MLFQLLHGPLYYLVLETPKPLNPLEPSDLDRLWTFSASTYCLRKKQKKQHRRPKTNNSSRTYTYKL